MSEEAKTQTVAEVLAQELDNAGIETVFGLPGGETVEVLDAFRRHGLRFVLVQRESAAVFMASATSRLTGKPTACLATLGPGATNAVTGVAHAYLDRAPVLIMTAETPVALRPYHTHQFVDLEELFAPITKASIALGPQRCRETIREALALTTSGRPGPVHIRFSNEESKQPASTTEDDLPDRPEPVHREDVLDRARVVLSKAKKPVLLAGLGLTPERPYAEIQSLAEHLRAPVILTPKAKGAVSNEHPLFAGVIGLTRTDPVYEVLDEADCILAIGFDVVELVKPWNHPAPLVWLADWSNHDPKIRADVELVGSMAPVLNELGKTASMSEDNWGENRVTAHRKKHSHEPPDNDPISPQQAMSILRKVLPRDTLVTTDVGSHKIFYCLEWPTFAPDRFLVSNGLSSMGYGLPAAIAARLVLPETPVVCMTGDAGLVMMMSELNTLARLRTPVVVVVFKDHALDLIRSHQKRSGKRPFGTEFHAPDFVQIAAGHGIEGRSVSDEAALADAMRIALESFEPFLIEVEIDPSTYPTTPG